ncbi:MAG: aminotransferase class I/II-fold pyridoxal phosphate-dependent enzyme [Spirochaetia bacterium]|nr:aminotransferase class I/II-fold pyridoxal phosphate-dependent enzyme [Spirochaetia bacterium]
MGGLADELNSVLENKPVYSLLSDLGKKLYFPKGIISQSNEAKKDAYDYNATIGMAMENGQPMYLPSMRTLVGGLSLFEIFAYAPTAGVPELRTVWMKEMLKKNPSLIGKKVSLPIITSGLTHGISLIADLFTEKGDKVLIPDMFWGNYSLIFSVRRGAEIDSFKFFDERYRFNVADLEKKIDECGKKVVVLLNFPNNPTGYSLTIEEQMSTVEVLKKKAEEGKSILVICDDSYFGLFFENYIETQSIFASLCDAHDNITAVKIDGSTKEDLVWGFRTGFITYGGKALDDESYAALEKKTMGAIRSTVSSCSTVSQNLILKGLKSSSYHQEKMEVAKKMKNRYNAVKKIVSSITYDIPLIPLPFNSGYFMTFVVRDMSAEALRKYLLDRYGIGTISIQDKFLRVAFSSVDTKDIPDLFAKIFKAAKELDKVV